MEFDSPELINEEAIEALTPEQIEQALAILTKAGYQPDEKQAPQKCGVSFCGKISHGKNRKMLATLFDFVLGVCYNRLQQEGTQ